MSPGDMPASRACLRISSSRCQPCGEAALLPTVSVSWNISPSSSSSSPTSAAACSASANKRTLCADAIESIGAPANAVGVVMTRSTLTTVRQIKSLIDARLDFHADQCGFHADSDTHSTHIRTVIPRSATCAHRTRVGTARRPSTCPRAIASMPNGRRNG